MGTTKYYLPFQGSIYQEKSINLAGLLLKRARYLGTYMTNPYVFEWGASSI